MRRHSEFNQKATDLVMRKYNLLSEMLCWVKHYTNKQFKPELDAVLEIAGSSIMLNQDCENIMLNIDEKIFALAEEYPKLRLSKELQEYKDVAYIVDRDFKSLVKDYFESKR